MLGYTSLRLSVSALGLQSTSEVLYRFVTKPYF